MPELEAGVGPLTGLMTAGLVLPPLWPGEVCVFPMQATRDRSSPPGSTTRISRIRKFTEPQGRRRGCLGWRKAGMGSSCFVGVGFPFGVLGWGQSGPWSRN